MKLSSKGARLRHKHINLMKHLEDPEALSGSVSRHWTFSNDVDVGSKLEFRTKFAIIKSKVMFELTAQVRYLS